MSALLLAAAFIPAAVDAATIETFTFVQTGYPLTGMLTGTFSGVVEPNGSIQQADLTALSASFTADRGVPIGIQVDSYSLTNLQLFSFIPSMDGPNSSLDIFASVTIGPPGSICVGAAAAFGLCGLGGNLAGIYHLIYQPNPFLWVSTTQSAVVLFVSAQSTTTPEPASSGLCGLAMASAFVWRRRQLGRRCIVADFPTLSGAATKSQERRCVKLAGVSTCD
jgi:hypothetical protein